MERAPGPDVVRRKLEPRANYADYRPELREDFWFSCAYCTIAETEAQAIGFQIDHYLPQAHHPELSSSYGNLMWACAQCNNLKRQDPTDADLQLGLEILRPDQHDFREHLESKGHRVEGRTVPGKWTIGKLVLNRRPLVKLREIRERLGYARELMVTGLRVLGRARIDGIPPPDRPMFLRARRSLQETGTEIEAELKASLRKRLASPLLDAADPEIAASRREELRRLRSTLT